MRRPDGGREAGAAVRWSVLPDADAVAREAAARVLAAARRAIAARECFRIVLAGGSTPERAYRRLAESDADWRAWTILLGDERCLPAGDPGRNDAMARAAWLDRVPLPAERIHPIPAELGPEEAAARYAPVVQAALPFDLVLLGLGEDGHTASLFPGHLHPAGGLVHAVRDAPKPPPERVSLSARALGTAREALVLVTGEGKREALARWRAGVALPIAAVRPENGLHALLDEDAAGE